MSLMRFCQPSNFLAIFRGFDRSPPCARLSMHLWLELAEIHLIATLFQGIIRVDPSPSDLSTRLSGVTGDSLIDSWALCRPMREDLLKAISQPSGCGLSRRRQYRLVDVSAAYGLVSLRFTAAALSFVPSMKLKGGQAMED